MKGFRTDKDGRWSPSYRVEQDEPDDFLGAVILVFLVWLLVATLTGCSNEQQASSRVISSESDTGGAMAIYRHNAMMDEKAREMGMIHPIKGDKK